VEDTPQLAKSRWGQEVLQEVLRPTYWFDPGEEGGEPYALTISFSGRRLDAKNKGKARPGDSFVQEQTVEGILPGSGPAAVTTEVRGINPGEWEVVAAPLSRLGERRPLSPSSTSHGHDHRGLWPRRVRPRAGRSQTLKTAMGPFAPIPGVHLVWAPLVILGVAVGLALQAVLLSRAGQDVGAALLASALAVFAGWVGAKGWYVAVHRGRRFDGWCIQGAVLGGAVVVAIILASGLQISAGAYLNAIAPGLMFGLAIGRPGCFLTGCCFGRPTTSRWGIWSSDRQLGIRRIPTQLMESLLCLAIGAVALALVLVGGLGDSGALLVAVIAAYTLGRQLILPFRAESRQTSLGRPLTIAIAGAVLVAAILATVL
jgi:phosphatidylglycerol:prolipoprotein diacylglycerol transferase